MLHKNLSLIGPPGSGKGSYGRHLAKALGIPLVTISDVLRKFRPDLDLSSGQLVDDHVVSDALLDGLKQYQKGYILDGFPRTLKQAQLMDTWPAHSQVQAALKLAVPDVVCETKLLGRRICKRCDGNYNVNGVDLDNWYLPPSLPENICDGNEDCDPYLDWITREDDQPHIVKERLSLYHQHMDPILEYFERRNRLLKLTPYKGYDDIPEIITTVQRWLEKIQDKEDK
jgi:adenylate kinase